jgi:hypothetical protein
MFVNYLEKTRDLAAFVLEDKNAITLSLHYLSTYCASKTTMQMRTVTGITGLHQLQIASGANHSRRLNIVRNIVNNIVHVRSLEQI